MEAGMQEKFPNEIFLPVSHRIAIR